MLEYWLESPGAAVKESSAQREHNRPRDPLPFVDRPERWSRPRVDANHQRDRGLEASWCHIFQRALKTRFSHT